MAGGPPMETRCLGLSKLNSVLLSLLFCTTEGENRAHAGARRMVRLGWPEFIPSQELPSRDVQPDC